MKNCIVLPKEDEEIRIAVLCIVQTTLPFWEKRTKEKWINPECIT